MATVQKSIDVEVPVSTVYNQWTQFESFPAFMGGVESVTQLDDTHNHWVTNIKGVEREFDTEITEQHPDERVAWRSTGGDSKHAGVVTFHRLDDAKTRVMAQIDWEPSGAAEKVGSAVNVDDRQVEGDLERFKELIETRGFETGAWRGDVPARRRPAGSPPPPPPAGGPPPPPPRGRTGGRAATTVRLVAPRHSELRFTLA